MRPTDLDRWLAEPALRTRHHRDAPTGTAELWAAAQTVRLGDCRVLGRLIRARIPGLDAGLTFEELFRNDPFAVVEEGEGFRLSALCGRIWSVRGEFEVPESPAAFLAWRVPGTVRVLFANWVEPAGPGARVVSEVRIAAIDRRARLYLLALEPFIAAFQALVATEPLSLAARRATAGEPDG